MQLRLHSVSVSWRLGLMVAFAMLAMLLVALAGWWGQRQASRVDAEITGRLMPAMSALGDLRASVGQLRRFEKDLFLHAGQPEPVERYLARWRQARGDAEGQLRQLPQHLGAEHGALVDGIGRGLAAYGQGLEGVAARLLKGEFADPVQANLAMEPLKGEIRQLDERLAALGAVVTQAVATQHDRLVASQRQQAVAQGVTLALAAVMLAVAAWAVVRSVTQPLAAAGDALGRLAQGDLGGEIAVEGHDELAHLMQRMATTQAALRRLVRTLQDQSQQVASATGQIAQGNAEFSARTEQQAASLQQTAASMEQLAGTLRSSTDSARRANERAAQAREAAEAGGGVVQQVVESMAQIQGASRQVADITSVIDGIAFQTNILALNAAVEAARAGEQGRGFAVVAAEVRTLAQRSAEAARQIKGLIASTVERIEAGHGQVQAAGATMQDMVERVREVSQLIAQVTQAAGEQQAGIDQVGQAVSELDRATQGNAAQVEESAAAAESLARQARELSDAAAAFRLPAGV